MAFSKIPVAILGATGMVGQRFITLLADHPWFEIEFLAASPRSAGKSYQDAVKNRWLMNEPIPETIKDLQVLDVHAHISPISQRARVAFSALNLDKPTISQLEEHYASLGVAVVSNNSAHRWTPDVPMIMPEINPHHTQLIDIQRQNRGWDRGLIAVKPNCSIQSYVPALEALKEFQPTQAIVSTYQAISGAGKTFDSWPEMHDNVIPYIGGEEQKSEQEPLRIWGTLQSTNVGVIHESPASANSSNTTTANPKPNDKYGSINQTNTEYEIPNTKYLIPASAPQISANCIRVPVSDGHLATVNVKLKTKPTPEQILSAWRNFTSPIDDLNLPSAPQPLITYFDQDDRPQTKLDRDLSNGMAVTLGRLRQDTILDYKFVCLSHNTIRGAAGGAILTAELLKAQGYIQ